MLYRSSDEFILKRNYQYQFGARTAPSLGTLETGVIGASERKLSPVLSMLKASLGREARLPSGLGESESVIH